MAVHLVWIRAQKPKQYTLGEIRDVVNDWVNSHNETLEAESTEINQLPIDTEKFPNQDPYVNGVFRFSFVDDKQELLDSIENDLPNKIKWYVIKYHVCTHDESETFRPGCSWDDERIDGTPPSYI